MDDIEIQGSDSDKYIVLHIDKKLNFDVPKDGLMIFK